jgi:hypothetical protein
MRLLAWMAAAILGLAAPISGADAATVWQGEAVVTAAAGCAAPPGETRRQIGVGTVMKSVLRPKGLDNQSLDTRVSFIHESGGFFAMVLPRGAMPAGTYAGLGATMSGILVPPLHREYVGFSQNPTKLEANDIFARLSGRIEDFMFVDGCDVTFRATYSKRPAGN